MKSGDLYYALECVFVPMAWGMVIMWVSMAIQSAAHKKSKSAEPNSKAKEQ